MAPLHTLKIEKPYADAILDGDKVFEVRYNDRGFQKGDLIRFVTLTEDFSKSPDSTHPLTNKIYQITYVHSGLGMKEGYVVLSIKPDNRYESDTTDNIAYVPINRM